MLAKQDFNTIFAKKLILGLKMMCLWVSYKEKKGKKLIFLDP
jgi:hypothetical protein